MRFLPDLERFKVPDVRDSSAPWAVLFRQEMDSGYLWFIVQAQYTLHVGLQQGTPSITHLLHLSRDKSSLPHGVRVFNPSHHLP